MVLRKLPQRAARSSVSAVGTVLRLPGRVIGRSAAQGARVLNILGTRGIPAGHGGFETFAAHLAPYLVERGWTVVVYCQSAAGAQKPAIRTDVWNGIYRVHVPTRTDGALGTMEFDLRSTLHAMRRPGLDLVLGYNTAVFALLQKARRRTVLMNMDGIEWQRNKWSRPAKAWFWLNERIGYTAADVMIADHPEIARHLNRFGARPCAVIPYGAEEIVDAGAAPLARFGLEPDGYFVSIARIEPENSILELVAGFSRQVRGRRLVVLGSLDPRNAYHRRLLEAAGPEVLFPGAIYDRETLRALRFHCRTYVHGHTVGGTNPSLVEAMGAGNAILAHDNRFNRWTAGDDHLFFRTGDDLADHFHALSEDNGQIARMRTASRRRFREAFTLDAIHAAYADLIEAAWAGGTVEA